MSTTELDHLIKMINQIADNIAIGESDDEAAAQLANHIKRFWARSMKDQIIEYADGDGARLKPVAIKAISQLRKL